MTISLFASKHKYTPVFYKTITSHPAATHILCCYDNTVKTKNYLQSSGEHKTN
jgi:hypothetical protein